MKHICLLGCMVACAVSAQACRDDNSQVLHIESTPIQRSEVSVGLFADACLIPLDILSSAMSEMEGMLVGIEMEKLVKRQQEKNIADMKAKIFGQDSWVHGTKKYAAGNHHQSRRYNRHHQEPGITYPINRPLYRGGAKSYKIAERGPVTMYREY